MRDTTPAKPRRATPVLLALPAEDVADVLPAERGREPVALPIADVLPVAPVDDAAVVQPAAPPRRSLGPLGVVGLIVRFLYSVAEWCFGAFTLTVGLAVLAAIPVAQFLSLGYLLEAGGRIGRTGRFRAGFIGVRRAARLGAVVGTLLLLLLPLWILSGMALDAEIIDPDGPTARRWKLGLTAATLATALGVAAALYLMLIGSRAVAAWRSGGLAAFLHRLPRGGFYTEARDAIWDTVVSLRLPYYFWLGLRGFVGGFLWLAPPVTLIALGRLIGTQGSNAAGGVGFLVGFAGALQLMFVLLQVPFLQMHFAATNRFRAFLEWDAVVVRFTRAPWAFVVALVLALLLALPLYLTKIEMIPREAAWIPSVFFVAFIFPTRLLAGWAYARSGRRQRRRHWFFIGTAPLLTLPVAAFYVLMVFTSQYTSWYGIWSLYEQHAFLLPVPFVGI
jgi:hypothetical protein